MPTRDELVSLAHDHFAQDLLDEATLVRMSAWSMAECESFFESGGTTLPARECGSGTRAGAAAAGEAAAGHRPTNAAAADHYQVLDVMRGASDDEIRRAYRKQAVKWHPDKNLGTREESEARFKQIAAAYDCLSDPRKRAAYDTDGADVPPCGGGGGAAYGDSFSADAAEEIFRRFFQGRDPFGDLVGGSGRLFGRAARRGASGRVYLDDEVVGFGGGFVDDRTSTAHIHFGVK